MQLLEGVSMVPVYVFPDESGPARVQPFYEELSPEKAQVCHNPGISETYTQEHTFGLPPLGPLPPVTSVGATLTIFAQNDLNRPDQFLNVTVVPGGGGPPTLVFNNIFAVGSATCTNFGSEEIAIFKDDWAAVIAVDGTARVTLSPSDEVFCECLYHEHKHQMLLKYPTSEAGEIGAGTCGMMWRSFEQVLDGFGTLRYLWGTTEYDPVTGAYIIARVSAKPPHTTLGGMNYAPIQEGTEQDPQRVQGRPRPGSTESFMAVEKCPTVVRMSSGATCADV